jgi:hypothetical protein
MHPGSENEIRLFRKFVHAEKSSTETLSSVGDYLTKRLKYFRINFKK